jgi:hypothetical protein
MSHPAVVGETMHDEQACESCDEHHSAGGQESHMRARGERASDIAASLEGWLSGFGDLVQRRLMVTTADTVAQAGRIAAVASDGEGVNPRR